jgi:hypothetical protein
MLVMGVCRLIDKVALKAREHEILAAMTDKGGRPKKGEDEKPVLNLEQVFIEDPHERVAVLKASDEEVHQNRPSMVYLQPSMSVEKVCRFFVAW